jgi:cyclopropane-fatty-acyl-phospholipid synthase
MRNIPRRNWQMRYSWLDRCLLTAMQKMAGPVPLRLALGPHFEDSLLSSSMLPLIRLKDRHTLISILRNPSINFGDLYSTGQVEVEGDLVRLLEEFYRIPQSRMDRLISGLILWMPSNSLRGSRKNIHHHYDLSTDFYKLWLDPQLVYTCAYFPDQSATLEEAQRAKLEMVCRKLWLRPGETVVEAGCGWGALAIHMARYYGVRVKAFNISREQIVFAREQAQREGLGSRVEFYEDDYRNISGTFDAFVSVGMLEHVGRSHYREFSRVIHRAVGDRGRGLLHFIGKNSPQPLQAWIRKRIFPGGYTPVLREVIEALEPYDFSVLDVENLRSHYARTLESWLSKFERSCDRVTERFGTTFARMWRLYLAGSTAAFRVGTLQLFQVVFAGRACNSQPWTREHLYSRSAKQNAPNVERIHAVS